MEFAERIFAVSPLAVVVLVLVTVGAFGGYWFYQRGRHDEHRSLLRYLKRLRGKD